MKTEMGGCRVLTALALVAGLGSGASADIELASQSRTAYAKSYTYVPPTATLHEENWAATDFSPADIELRPAGGSGNARHRSVLASDHITASLYGSGAHLLQGWNSSGRTTIDVTFMVSEPTPFELWTSWSASYQTGDTLIEMTGPGVSYRYVPDPSSPRQGTGYASGVLQPGMYTISGMAQGSGATAMFPTGTGRASFTLAVPGPGGLAVVTPALMMAARRRRA